MNAKRHNESTRRLFHTGGTLRLVLEASEADTPTDHSFRSLRGLTYKECPCGCGAKEVCEAQQAKVKANDDRIPF